MVVHAQALDFFFASTKREVQGQKMANLFDISLTLRLFFSLFVDFYSILNTFSQTNVSLPGVVKAVTVLG